jgi:hypothetical protein
VTDDEEPGLLVMTEAAAQRQAERAYRLGIEHAKAEIATDLRCLADDMVEQVFQLRCELRKALGLPPPAGPGDQGTLQ